MRYIVFLSFLLNIVFAQGPAFSISGKVVDQKSKSSMEYCTVSLFDAQTNQLLTGVVSDIEGKFTLTQLKPGQYYLEISFIGFEVKRIDDILVSMAMPKQDLGIIYLGSDATVVKEVEVTALKSSVRYELDKKIVDVDKNITAANGTAVDVLATVPSIQQNIDGDISLRGSTGFLVLINGRPSVLDANEALRQIPANTIKNIEIITNPSARYDAEGTAGIINIITKKKADEGLSGIVNARGGTFNSYGGDATLALKKNKFTYTLSGNYRHNDRPGTYSSTLNTTLNDTTVSTINDGNKKRTWVNYNVKGGIEYRPTKNQFIGLSYTYGGWRFDNEDELDFSFVNQATGEVEEFVNRNESARKGPFHEIIMDYGYDFNKESKLSAHFSYNRRGFEERIYSERFDDFDNLIFGTQSSEIGPSERFRFNIDYVIPIEDHSKFELGLMQQYNTSDEENIAYQKDVVSGDLIEQPQFYSDVKYKTNIRAFYGMFSSKLDKFSYQIGLRTENTLRDIYVKNTGASFIVDRLDFFPSLSVSFNHSENHQFFVNYSKRINRPRGWYLEPNAIFTDANTLWQGNPGILPEYIHSFEAGWLFNFKKKGSWNNELYLRRELNTMQVVRVPLDFELTRQFPENVGTSNSLGLESSLSLLPFKWWNTDLLANLFYFNLKGSYQDEIFDRSSFSYILRWNNYFKITKTTKLQFNGSYSSPIVNAQGRESYTIMFDAGLRQDFFDGKMNLGIQVRDLFNTYVNRSWLDGNNFDFERENDPRGPSVVFSASYSINNYRPKRSQYGDDGGEF
jgi:outer membrane receptor protein involved in Fe transport